MMPEDGRFAGSRPKTCGADGMSCRGRRNRSMCQPALAETRNPANRGPELRKSNQFARTPASPSQRDGLRVSQCIVGDVESPAWPHVGLLEMTSDGQKLAFRCVAIEAYDRRERGERRRLAATPGSAHDPTGRKSQTTVPKAPDRTGSTQP